MVRKSYKLARLEAGYVILRMVEKKLLTGITAAYQSRQRRRTPKTKFDALIWHDRRIRTCEQCVAVGIERAAVMPTIREVPTEVCVREMRKHGRI
jgi:hypothetical protein